MAKDGTLLEDLRRRLAEVKSRHEADAQGEAARFWETLAAGAESDTEGSESSGGPAGDGWSEGDCGSTGSDGSTGGGGSGSDGGSGGHRRSHGRTRKSRVRGHATARVRGPWGAVASPTDPVLMHPSECQWVDYDALPPQARLDQPNAGPGEAGAREPGARGPASGGTGSDVPGWDGTNFDGMGSEAPASDGTGSEETGWDVPGGGGPGSEGPGARVVERSEPVAVKTEAVLGMSLHRHGQDELTHAVDHLAGLRAQQEVMLVNVVAELDARGVESPGGLSRVDWLRSLDQTLTAAQAKEFVTVAAAVGQPAWRELGARVSMQHITVGKAARIIGFHERAARVADPDELDAATADLLGQAAALTPEELARLARHHDEQIRPPRDEDAADAGRVAARGLWFGQPNASGMVGMRGTLDPEAAAVIKSAVDPLARPCPATDRHGRTTEPDPRSPAKRRADALVEIVGRGVAAAERVPTTDKAKVVVTIDVHTLFGLLRGAGVCMSGDVLSAETVRRLACDAAIVPMVLGRKGEVLDLGREVRLVTKGLRLALWQRDGGCTFPGCTVPAQWTDAHHGRHWSRGGETSLLNCCLLCPRHHTYVHRHDLVPTITTTEVIWHE